MYTILERKIADIDFFAEHFWSSSSGIRRMVGKEQYTITPSFSDDMQAMPLHEFKRRNSAKMTVKCDRA
jgi:hypothetical protein